MAPATASRGLVLAIVTVLAFWQLGQIHQQVRATPKEHFRSDADFYRHLAVLGNTYRLVERIQLENAPGTPVSIPFEVTFPLYKITRLWLALVPHYPISSGAVLEICPPTACDLQEGDEVLERDVSLLLVRRGSGSR